MQKKLNELTAMLMLTLLISAARAQENSIFSDLAEDPEPPIKGLEYPQRSSVSDEVGPNYHNVEWIYLRDIAQEYESLSDIASLRNSADSTVIDRIGILASSYLETYNTESSIRKDRMCAEYRVQLLTLSATEAADVAITHMETTDQLIARRRALGESFLKNVFDNFGDGVMSEIVRQTQTLSLQTSSYFVRTTRDMIDTIGADKVSYIENSCRSEVL